MRLSVQLVTWNGAKYLSGLFASLKSQTHIDFELHILDNGSIDDTVNLIEKELATLSAFTTFECNTENTGFVAGHNAMFERYRQEPKEDYLVLLLNQDVVLELDCFEKIVDFMQRNPRAAACSPRIMQMWCRNQIDSLGMVIYKNGRSLDWMNGEVWKEELFELLPQVTEEHRQLSITNYQLPRYIEVFGVSGAVPCYRVSVIKSLPGKISSGIFDSAFFSYKEDVDLAWQLRKMGWKAYTLIDAIAYHDRSAAGPGSGTDAAAALHWKEKSEFIRKYSYRNHWFVIIKNMKITPRILWFEFRKLIYLLITDPKIVRFTCRFGNMLKQRRILNRAQRVHDIELKRWMM